MIKSNPSNDAVTPTPIRPRPGARIAPATPAERFERFHDANPHVYDHLLHLARQWQRAGRGRLGIRALWERARWDLTIGVNELDTTARHLEPWKLHDHLPAYYVRLIIVRNPDLADMFAIRTSEQADTWITDYARRATAPAA